MRYLCLAYYDEQKFQSLTPSDLEAIRRRCEPHDAALRESGHLVLSARLQPPSASAVVRPRNGRPSITDGPFAETKEQVGGLFVIDAKDLNEALLVASKHPAALMNEQLGWGIEVRAIDDYRPA
jgi:hypothetical protein